MKRKIAKFPSDIVVQEWHKRALAEYYSAVLMAQLKVFLEQCAFSSHLISLCDRIISDELRHTTQCLSCLHKWGFAPPMANELIRIPSDVLPLEKPLYTIMSSFVLGETVAVPLFERMLCNAKDNHVKHVLQGILKDEKMHRSFAWQLLDGVLACDLDTMHPIHAHIPAKASHRIRGYIQEDLYSWIVLYREGYVHDGSDWELHPDDTFFGLIDGRTYKKTWLTCFQNVIRPRLIERHFRIPPV